MATDLVKLVSTSAAMDGGCTAVAEVSAAMAAAGAQNRYRLIGGAAVLLHIERLGLDPPLRATGDADFGLLPCVLREPVLAAAIEGVGYRKVLGNRWERKIDERRVAAVDLVVPTYRTRARDNVRVGTIVTTEVPGLAEAFQRPSVDVEAEFHITDGRILVTATALPDAVSLLMLKTLARTVRSEDRDVADLWRCLEIAAAERIEPATFDTTESLANVREILWHQLGPDGSALTVLTAGLQPEPAARLRTRVRALLAETVGPVPT